MWVIPGEPITAAAVPLWVEAQSSPEALWRGANAPLWEESLRVKKIVRPFPEPDRKKYLNLTPLDNAAGTGFLPSLVELERQTVGDTVEFLRSNRTRDELRIYQERQAQRVLEALRAID
jgi:hypothetical protein